jgi:hypothetical protein
MVQSDEPEYPLACVWVNVMLIQAQRVVYVLFDGSLFKPIRIFAIIEFSDDGPIEVIETHLRDDVG